MIKAHENGTYILFVKTTCPYCHMAVDLLEEKNIPYKKIILGDRSIIAEEVKSAFGWKTVPIIFFKNNEHESSYQLIGGFTDLEKIING